MPKKKEKTIFDLITEYQKFNPWEYCAEYDYDVIRDCENFGCDWICRCSQIENIEIQSVDVNGFYESVLRNLNLTTKASGLERYAISRCISVCEIYNTESWDAHTTGGYYGEELVGPYLVQIVKDTFCKYLRRFFKKPTMDTLFEIEYGHVLDHYKSKKWELETVDRKNLLEKQDKRVKANKGGCVDPSGISGAVRPDYKIIDGHHRIYSSDKDKLKIWVMKNEV